MSILNKKVSSHYPFLALFLFVFVSLTFVSLTPAEDNLTGFGVFDGFFSFLRTTPLRIFLPDIPSSQPLHKQLTLTITPQDITLDKQIEATTFVVTPQAAATSLTSTDLSLFSTTKLQTFFLPPLQQIITDTTSGTTPQPEICNDITDNDRDGFADCGDNNCATQYICSCENGQLDSNEGGQDCGGVCPFPCGTSETPPATQTPLGSTSLSCINDEACQVTAGLGTTHFCSKPYAASAEVVGTCKLKPVEGYLNCYNTQQCIQWYGTAYSCGTRAGSSARICLTSTQTTTTTTTGTQPPPSEQPAASPGEPSGNEGGGSGGGGGSGRSSSYSGKSCVPDWNCELTPCIEEKQQVVCTDANNCLIYNGQQRACNSQTDNLGTIPYDEQLVQDLPVETYYEEDQSALAGEYVDEEIKDEGISGWIIALLIFVVLGIGGGITWYVLKHKGQSPPPQETASWTPIPSQNNNPPQQPSA